MQTGKNLGAQKNYKVLACHKLEPYRNVLEHQPNLSLPRYERKYHDRRRRVWTRQSSTRTSPDLGRFGQRSDHRNRSLRRLYQRCKSLACSSVISLNSAQRWRDSRSAIELSPIRSSLRQMSLLPARRILDVRTARHVWLRRVSPLQRKNAATLPPSTVVTSPVVFSAKA